METQSSALPSQFLAALEKVLGTPDKVHALHEPEFRGNEWPYLKECVDTGWVSSVGKFVDQFEAGLASYTGAKHAVAVANGTVALQVALILAGVQPGDEVIVPALTFVATANAVVHCGAIPHFVDSSPITLGMDPEALASHLEAVSEATPLGLRNRKTGRRIAAMVPMHAFGHPADMHRLMELANRLKVGVVEDAAESIGSSISGKMTGTFGLLGILSFNGNKTITTGGGGALLTDDSTLAKRAKHLTTTAKIPHRWEFFHDETGFNFRLPNLNAAMGCAQLERLPDILKRKRDLANRYQAAFRTVKGMNFITEPGGTVSNYWLNSVKLDVPDMGTRNEILEITNHHGYQCRPAWTLLHKLPMYRDCPRATLAVAETLEASLINIPSSARLAEISNGIT